MATRNISENDFKLSVVLSCQATRFAAATLIGDFEINLTFLAGLGYDGVELAIRNPDEIDLDWIYHLVDGCSLAVPAIGTGQAWGEEGLSFSDPVASIRKKAIQRIQSHIPAAKHFNALIIIGLIRGKTQPGVSRAQALDWVADGLRECAQTADSAGVRLCIEPINHGETDLINTAAEGLELIDRIGADNLGLLLDTYHMNIEEADIAAAMQSAGAIQSASATQSAAATTPAGGKIFHFHVADSNRHYPGAGQLDFPRIIAALKATGYNGFISGEFLPLPDPQTVAGFAIARLRALTSSGSPVG